MSLVTLYWSRGSHFSDVNLAVGLHWVSGVSQETFGNIWTQF